MPWMVVLPPQAGREVPPGAPPVEVHFLRSTCTSLLSKPFSSHSKTEGKNDDRMNALDGDITPTGGALAPPGAPPVGVHFWHSTPLHPAWMNRVIHDPQEVGMIDDRKNALDGGITPTGKMPGGTRTPSPPHTPPASHAAGCSPHTLQDARHFGQCGRSSPTSKSCLCCQLSG